MSCCRLAVILLFSAAASFDGSPIIRGNTVRFVAAGTPSDPPRIVGDFNGWQGGEMAPAAGGRTFTLDVALDPAARIEYLIAYKNRFVRDPGNPLTVPAPAGPPRSELRMPGYRRPPLLPRVRVHGAIEEIPFTSKTGKARRLRVYVPPGSHADRLPVVYAYDGDIFVNALRLPRMLDALIGSGRMAPAFVAFIDAIDRHDDYAAGSPFRSVFALEIVPLTEHRYAVDNRRRVLIGLSRSTVGALDTCAHAPISFESCVLIAPAIPANQFSALLPGRSTRIFIATGTYDIPLVADARALRRELQRRGTDVHYVESPEGHNHTAFRASLLAMLPTLLPVRR